MNKHNFCLGEGLERLAHISRTEQIKVDEAAPVFAKSRRRQKHWHVSNSIEGPPGDMQDYASVSEIKCVEAWELGLEDARKLAVFVGMEEVLAPKGKWDEPWHFFSAEAELSKLAAEKEEEDGDENPDEDNFVAPSSDSPDTADPEIELETDQALDLCLSLLSALQGADSDEEEGQIPEVDTSSTDFDFRGRTPEVNTLSTDADFSAGRTARAKVATTVHVPGKGQVYKMRVISQLNETPDKLSLDRLRRVQQRAKEDFGLSNESSDDVHEVALFSNVALWLKDGDRHRVQMARVQKIFRVGTRGGKTDVQHPSSSFCSERLEDFSNLQTLHQGSNL